MREGVRQAAIEWDEAARDESRLVHRGARLDEAAAVAGQARFAPNARERAYLDACALTLTLESGSLTSPRLSPDGRWLAGMGGDDTWLWDLHAAAPAPIPLTTYVAAPGASSRSYTRATAFSADSATIATVAGDGLHVDRIGDGAPVEIGSDPTSMPTALGMSHDGSLSAGFVSDVSNKTKSVRIWTTQPSAYQRDLITSADQNFNVEELVFSPDHRYLAMLISNHISNSSGNTYIGTTGSIWDLAAPAPEQQPLDLEMNAPLAFIGEGPRVMHL
ncbi:MAG: WD40 repeat domain-containing protein [Oscillochloris sp.]|nr:WD40 repeat domain-containing protein [Oscillochloris sp.]